MRLFFTLAMTLVACGGEDPAPEPATIETVSQQITFDSVDRLGSHHSISSIQHSDIRGPEETVETTQTIEIAWNSWESFHFQRYVDGMSVFEAINHDGTSASRNRRGQWNRAGDGESARIDVYTAWNAWDEALEGFRDRIILTEKEATIVDGRPARKFALSLGPVPENEPIRTSGLLPHRLEGTVTLDSATAVRLRADVLAVSKQKNRTRRIQLNIRRTGVGEVQDIEVPQVPLRAPGDLLRKLPERPKRQ
jgi:hypothetical protein